MINPPWNGNTKLFLPWSKLYLYLIQNQPTYINKSDLTYRYNTIFTALAMEISREKMFDENNPSILILNKQLEHILRVKYLHITEMVDIIEKEFIPENNVYWEKTSTPGPMTAYRSPIWSVGNDRYLELYRSVPDDFDKDADYKLKPDFYEMLKEFLPEDTQVFHYDIISKAMTNYVAKHKDQIIYPKTKNVLLLEGTPLEQVFKMKTMGRHQVAVCVRSQCIPL